jgi:hypothetical protein
MIEAGLFHLLRTTEAIAAIVGSRVYPVRVPEDGAPPCIVFRRDSTEFTDGLGDEEQTGPDTPRFTLECWAEAEGFGGYKQACTLADAVVTALRTHRGAMGENSEIVVKNIVIEDVRDEETALDDASDYHRFLRTVDIAIEYDPAQV